MAYFKTNDTSESISLYYEDHGTGHPVILIHGWPVTSQMWENQILFLAEQGFRCISYDRRGFGKSDKPWSGHEYDTLANDLSDLIEHLDLEQVTLVGFSMGGGELIRYLSTYGTSKIKSAVLISSVVPGLLKSSDNPDGADQSLFDGMLDGIKKDRQNFMKDFGKNFYGVSMMNHKVSEAVLDWHWSLCMQGNMKATLDCVIAFSATNFVSELSAVDIPLLLIHGDADAIVPIEITSKRVKEQIPNADFKIYKGAPHGLYITEKDNLNQDLLTFINA